MDVIKLIVQSDNPKKIAEYNLHGEDRFDKGIALLRAFEKESRLEKLKKNMNKKTSNSFHS